MMYREIDLKRSNITLNILDSYKYILGSEKLRIYYPLTLEDIRKILKYKGIRDEK